MIGKGTRRCVMKLRVVVRAVIALLFACSAAFAQGRVERFEVDFLDGRLL